VATNHHVGNQKSLCHGNCLTDCYEIWYGDVVLYSLSVPVLALKIQNIFKNPSWDNFGGFGTPKDFGVKISSSV